MIPPTPYRGVAGRSCCGCACTCTPRGNVGSAARERSAGAPYLEGEKNMDAYFSLSLSLAFSVSLFISLSHPPPLLWLRLFFNVFSRCVVPCPFFMPCRMATPCFSSSTLPVGGHRLAAGRGKEEGREEGGAEGDHSAGRQARDEHVDRDRAHQDVLRGDAAGHHEHGGDGALVQRPAVAPGSFSRFFVDWFCCRGFWGVRLFACVLLGALCVCVRVCLNAFA